MLELVEGETLAERLGAARAVERSLPLAEALAIARQIAEALEAAHEKGIVHRDLKPANIKITPRRRREGARLRPGEGVGGDGRRPGPSHSPTVTATARATGVILGTAAYMSPEQARGQAVDKRTDIWAFGCVLYEMLTGRAAFRRETRVGHDRGDPRARAGLGRVAGATRRGASGGCCAAASRRIRSGGCTTSPTRASRSRTSRTAVTGRPDPSRRRRDNLDQSFVMNSVMGETNASPITVILNWKPIR